MAVGVVRFKHHGIFQRGVVLLCQAVYYAYLKEDHHRHSSEYVVMAGVVVATHILYTLEVLNLNSCGIDTLHIAAGLAHSASLAELNIEYLCKNNITIVIEGGYICSRHSVTTHLWRS